MEKQKPIKLAQEKHDKQAAKVCPTMNDYDSAGWVYCQVEQCAAWDSDRECCGMLPYKGINTHPY